MLTRRFVIGSLLASRLRAAATWRLMPAEGSKVILEVTKTGIMRGKKHQLVFTDYDGTLNYDAARPEQSQVRLSVDGSKVKCQDTWLKPSDVTKVEEYTRKDMLNASKYPRMSFQSTSIQKEAADRYAVQGTLTIRDVTKAVRLTATVQPSGNQMTINGACTFRMTEFGMKPPSAALGTVGTQDEMTLTFQVRAVAEA